MSKNQWASGEGRRGKRGNWKPRWGRSDSEASAAPRSDNKDDSQTSRTNEGQRMFDPDEIGDSGERV